MEPPQYAQPQNVAAEMRSDELLQRLQALEAMAVRHERLIEDSQAETSEWERALDAIEDPICLLTPDYWLLWANAAYTRLFGVDRERHERHFCFSVSGGAEQGGTAGPCEDCPLPSVILERRSGFVQQEWMSPVGPDGSREMRTYQRWIYPVVNTHGAVERIVEVLKDVTEQEQMRHAIAQDEALREADRLKAELLGTVSHELRSPLAAIKGYAATLLRHERRLPPEERHEFLRAIVDASDRLETIIDRLLEMSQLETGSARPQFSSVDIVRVVREALLAAEQKDGDPSQRSHTFELIITPKDGSPSLPPPVIEADPRLVREALDNLLENAVKYTPEGGLISVTVTVSKDGVVGAQPGGTVEITVRDTGVGIPAEHVGRVFDRFHRVDTRLTREVDGLGLGLAMCKRIAELHGGSIWAESAPNEGSAFHLSLPFAQVAERLEQPAY